MPDFYKMKYYAEIAGTDGDYVVTFRDIPEAITGAETYEKAKELATDALITALDFYFDDRRALPEPSIGVDGEFPVQLPTSVAAKALLLNRMVSTGTTAAELARRLGTTPQSVNRLVNLHHPTKIDTVANAMHALGVDLELRCVAA